MGCGLGDVAVHLINSNTHTHTQSKMLLLEAQGCPCGTGILRRRRKSPIPQPGSLVGEPDGFIHRMDCEKSLNGTGIVSPNCLGKMAPNLGGCLPNSPWFSIALGLSSESFKKENMKWR